MRLMFHSTPLGKRVGHSCYVQVERLLIWVDDKMELLSIQWKQAVSFSVRKVREFETQFVFLLPVALFWLVWDGY